MAETKVLSFSKKKSNRRKLLKEFYKLQESNKRELENLSVKTAQTTAAEGGSSEAKVSTSATDKDDDLTLSNFDDYIRGKDFKTLISLENMITEQLNSNQGEIKSIIYNNYYELIKISNYLENLKNGTDTSAMKSHGDIANEDDVDDDNTEFTIGVDDEEDKDDSMIIILNKIRENISSLKSQDLYI